LALPRPCFGAGGELVELVSLALTVDFAVVAEVLNGVGAVFEEGF
jgi:hypothetical protein